MHPVSSNGIYSLLREINSPIDEQRLLDVINKGDPAILRSFIQQNNIDIHQVLKNGFTILIEAVIRKNLPMVKCLVEQCGADVNQFLKDGSNALAWAAGTGDIAIVQFLVEKNIQVHCVHENGATPLFFAIEQGHLPVVQYLVDICHLDVNQLFAKGTTPLIYAVLHGHSDVVRFLLNTGRVNIDHREEDGTTALFMAVYQRHVDIVRYLVRERGAFVDPVLLASGATPLCIAVEKRDLEMLTCLVEECGANVHHLLKDGSNALLYAAQSGDIESVRFLVEKNSEVNWFNDNGETPLSVAMYCGYAAITEYLVNTGGADLDTALRQGFPLILAAEKGHTDLVRFLAQTGKVNLNQTQRQGHTALLAAVSHGHVDTVRCLIDECRVDIHYETQVNGVRAIPLIYAAAFGYLPIVQLLLDTGEVEVDQMQEDGDTAFSLAAANNHLEVVRYLAQRYAAVVNSPLLATGVTPLLTAADRGDFDMLRCLVEECDAEINLPTHDGRTPLMVAIMQKHVNIVRFLVKRPYIDMDRRRNNGDTALHLAAVSGQLEICELLVSQGARLNDLDINIYSEPVKNRLRQLRDIFFV